MLDRIRAEVVAVREKSKRIGCHIAACLGRPIDSVYGKCKEVCYKVILDRYRDEDSSKLCALIQRGLSHISSRTDKPTPSATNPVLGAMGPASDVAPTRDVGGDLEASNRKMPSVSHADDKRAFLSAAELDIVMNARLETTAKELAKSLPNCTAHAIQCKHLNLWLKADAPLISPPSHNIRSESAVRPGKDPPDVASGHPDLELNSQTGTAVVLIKENVEEVCGSSAAASTLSPNRTSEKLSNIREYILSILRDKDRQIDVEFAARVRQVLDGVATLKSIYALVLPNRRKSRRGMGGLQVKPGVRSQRNQKSKVYRYLKKTYRYSHRMVAEKILNDTASYEDLSRKEGFTADDFVKAWKPIFERSDEGCAIPALYIKEIRWELLHPIKISEVADSFKKNKNSAPGPDGYQLKDILPRPIEQVTIEGSLENHPDQVGFKRLDGVAYKIMKLQKTLESTRGIGDPCTRSPKGL